MLDGEAMLETVARFPVFNVPLPRLLDLMGAPASLLRNPAIDRQD
jgi:hypothetical protein